jgi:hypothetical protein
MSGGIVDKWQEREARRLAADEGVSEVEARRRLFPADGVAEGDGESTPAEAEAEENKSATVSTRKR